jgi:hypothetical protein
MESQKVTGCSRVILEHVAATRPILNGLLAKTPQLNWLYNLAGEISNCYFPEFVCQLCVQRIGPASAPNRRLSTHSAGWICLACVPCDFCHMRCEPVQKTIAGGFVCCKMCQDNLIRYARVCTSYGPSPYQHRSGGVTRVFNGKVCVEFDNNILLASVCNDHTATLCIACSPEIQRSK